MCFMSAKLNQKYIWQHKMETVKKTYDGIRNVILKGLK